MLHISIMIAVFVMSTKRVMDTVAFLFMKGVFEVKHSGNYDKNRTVLSQKICKYLK